jgi:hypothetical protein
MIVGEYYMNLGRRLKFVARRTKLPEIRLTMLFLLAYMEDLI